MFNAKAESDFRQGKNVYGQKVSNLLQFTKTLIPKDLTVGFGLFMCQYVAKTSTCLPTKFIVILQINRILWVSKVSTRIEENC